MAKTIVTGGLGFLGFELCLALLEEGVEVLAADFASRAGERWLEVGRNSNITYQSLSQPVSEKVSEGSLYINLYDYFTGKRKEEHLKHLRSFIERNISVIEDSVVLLPTVLSDRKEEKELSDFLSFLQKQSTTNRNSVYLPSLLGPFQPETFLFQQLISESDIDTGYVDDMRSAIYVKDAAKAILSRGGRNSDNVLLLSDTQDSWQKSLKLLGRTEKEREEKQNQINILPEKLKIVNVKASISFEDVLTLQKKS
ncbi:MAG: hypothetical protein ACQEUT_17970 [Bacillota bacterium]